MTGNSIKPETERSFGIVLPSNPAVIPQNAALAVIRSLQTLISATSPKAETNRVPAKYVSQKICWSIMTLGYFK
jgi:hypothetical protein